MIKDTFNPMRILEALKSNYWTSILFNNRGEVGAEGDGGGADFEATAIPADKYVDNPNISKYKTIGDLIKGHSEASKLIGAKGVIVPGDNAEPAEVDKFYNTLGRPEKPEGYKFDKLEKLHPELQITPEVEAGFNKFVHKYGLSQKQAAGIRAEYFNALSQSLTKRDEVATKAKHEAETTLRTEWGADYDTKLKRVQTIIDKFGGNGARQAFGELGNNPAVLKVLATIADKFSEDTFTLGGTHTESSIAEAQKKILAIQTNKEHMYHKPGIGHDEAVKEMLELHKIAYPEATQV